MIKMGKIRRVWINKYCKCDETHFEITREGVKHKGVLFLVFECENDYNNLINMDERDKYDYLNGEWNFYTAMNY
jgi:hypothetical protein